MSEVRPTEATQAPTTTTALPVLSAAKHYHHCNTSMAVTALIQAHNNFVEAQQRTAPAAAAFLRKIAAGGRGGPCLSSATVHAVDQLPESLATKQQACYL